MYLLGEDLPVFIVKLGIIYVREGLCCLAVSETHFRKDVPNQRFDINGYHHWDSERSGSDKVWVIKSS